MLGEVELGSGTKFVAMLPGRRPRNVDEHSRQALQLLSAMRFI